MARGFTIVELLVVITIIVVLLALLAPAMDRAIYQAELAICEAKLHAIATGVIVYASESKRRYPDRPSFRGNSSPGAARPFDLYAGNQGFYKPGAYTLDDRAILRQFLSINKTLQCPFVKPVDLEGADRDSYVASSYLLYFGVRYTFVPGLKGMYKLGDRLEWDDIKSNYLASDSDLINVANSPNVNFGSHPDNDPTMRPYRFQDRDYIGTDTQSPALQATWSFWIGNERNPVDSHFVSDDGAVTRFTDVKWDEGDPNKVGAEERFVWFPSSAGNTGPNEKFRMPRPN